MVAVRLELKGFMLQRGPFPAATRNEEANARAISSEMAKN